MNRPTSYRMPEDLLERLHDASQTGGQTASALVIELLDEGLKTRRFPGIVYRDGTTGRRAGLADGPDVWEIIRDLATIAGPEDDRISTLAEEVDLSPRQVELAVAFYSQFPQEIDERISVNERAAAQLTEIIASRERLMAM